MTTEEPARAPEVRLQTTASVGAPRLFGLHALVQYEAAFALGATLEYLPPSLAKFGDDTTLSWLTVGLEGRMLMPFWQPLYAGASFGYQMVRADSRRFGSEVDYLSRAPFCVPKVGVSFVVREHWVFGGELGVTIPVGAETVLRSDGTEDSNARKVARTFAEHVMPFFGARFGYRF